MKIKSATIGLPPHLCRLHVLCPPLYASDFGHGQELCLPPTPIFPLHCFSSTLMGSDNVNCHLYDGESPNCVFSSGFSELTVYLLKLFKYLKIATSLFQRTLSHSQPSTSFMQGPGVISFSCLAISCITLLDVSLGRWLAY